MVQQQCNDDVVTKTSHFTTSKHTLAVLLRPKRLTKTVRGWQHVACEAIQKSAHQVPIPAYADRMQTRENHNGGRMHTAARNKATGRLCKTSRKLATRQHRCAYRHHSCN
jgi:hypothetical protein